MRAHEDHELCVCQNPKWKEGFCRGCSKWRRELSISIKAFGTWQTWRPKK